jgi:hypothetical protein
LHAEPSSLSGSRQSRPDTLFPVPLLLAGISAYWGGASIKKAVLIAVVGGLCAFAVFLVVALILFTIHLAVDYP